MKITLRIKFLTWLMVHTLLVFAAIGLALFAFNLHERHEHPDQAAEEAEELYIIFGLMIATLPIAVASAWGVSRQLLRPLHNILLSAENIRAGHLQQRIISPHPHDEIGRLARTLNEAFDSYQQVLQRLDRFGMDAAHQLRNPLAAIRTHAEICLQQKRSAEEYQNTLVLILDNVRRLSHTVDQLLMLARLGRGTLRENLEQFDLASLIRTVVEPVELAFEEKKISLSMKLPQGSVLIRGVPRLLEQAIANLLDNALRLTPAGGKVQIELHILPTGALAVSIADSGPGLPATLQDTSVDQFGKTIGSLKEGAGLGLAIASDVLRAHQGSLTASRSELGGARFVMTLPQH